MSGEPVAVREYRAGDLDDVLRLSIDAWAPNFASVREVLGDEMFRLQHGNDWREYQRASVTRTLAGADQAWVAEADGAVAGFVTVSIHEDEPIGEVVMLAVDPQHQRSGIASALLTHAEEWMRAAGVPVAFVQTAGDPGHAPARAAYERAGYTFFPAVQYFKAL